jgi:hypothetical protein
MPAAIRINGTISKYTQKRGLVLKIKKKKFYFKTFSRTIFRIDITFLNNIFYSKDDMILIEDELNFTINIHIVYFKCCLNKLKSIKVEN